MNRQKGRKLVYVSLSPARSLSLPIKRAWNKSKAIRDKYRAASDSKREHMSKRGESRKEYKPPSSCWLLQDCLSHSASHCSVRERDCSFFSVSTVLSVSSSLDYLTGSLCPCSGSSLSACNHCSVSSPLPVQRSSRKRQWTAGNGQLAVPIQCSFSMRRIL